LSDCDCPDCAPYCSTSGYCQAGDWSGSTPCENRECNEHDDCYIEKDVYLELHPDRGDCRGEAAPVHYCLPNNTCMFRGLYVTLPYHPCNLDWDTWDPETYEHCEWAYEGATGSGCPASLQECKRAEPKRAYQETCNTPTFVAGSVYLKDLSVTAGVSFQVGEERVDTRQKCPTGRCRNRAGECCKLVRLSSRSVCPFFC
jgi:hypothetical protein